MKSAPGQRAASGWWALIFALGVSVLYGVADDFSLLRMSHYQWTRQDSTQPVFNTLVFAAAYLLALAGLIVVHGHARKTIRYASFAIAVAAAAVFFGFSNFNGRPFTIVEASLVWAELEFVPGAVSFFFADYALPLLLAAVAVVLLEGFARLRLFRFESLWFLCLPLIAVGVCYELLVRTDSKVDQFPISLRVPVLLAYAANHQSVYLGARDERFFDPSGEVLADHVVFIVDESIRGDLLSINGGPKEVSPYLESIRDRLLNYGVCSAVANLSAPANIIMQSGLRLDQLPDIDLRSMKNPSLFSYMQAAGFYTTMINAQNALARPPNFMTPADVAGLDAYLQIRELGEGVERAHSDRLVAPILEQIVGEHDRSFTYVIKMGAHFPYANSYPKEWQYFEADTSVEGRSPRRAELVSSYMNSLRWSVDEFLRELVPVLEGTGKKILVVYTADHGQSLFEITAAGGNGVRGHGQHQSPPVHQAMVPLFLIPIGEGMQERFRARFHPSRVDRSSAFELFSTLLQIGGYAPRDFDGDYAPSIFQEHADRGKRRFVSGNHFGADGPLYRSAPYRSSFQLNDFDAER